LTEENIRSIFAEELEKSRKTSSKSLHISGKASVSTLTAAGEIQGSDGSPERKKGCNGSTGSPESDKSDGSGNGSNRSSKTVSFSDDSAPPTVSTVLSPAISQAETVNGNASGSENNRSEDSSDNISHHTHGTGNYSADLFESYHTNGTNETDAETNS
jgi:hypothetical protein